jgi:aminoglycoside phosphotransferase (APT) family kinase protein
VDFLFGSIAMTIPASWAEPVRTALLETFGVEAPDSVTPVTGGMSGAPVLRLQVGGKSYLLRLDPPVDGFGDPRHWHGCMKIAAEAGVAPRVHYAKHGVSIVDFVEQDPQTSYFAADRNAILTQLGGMLRTLHDGPAFPPLFNYLDGMEVIIDRVRSAGLMSPEELAAPLARFARVSDAYRGLEPQLVSSHNDVNPRNLVYDDHRLWLVDWTAAFLSDRYIDLAAIASFVAREEDTEALFLAAYFGRPAREAERARMYLARQINHMFYAMVMMTTTGGVRPETVRSMDEIHLALRMHTSLLDTPVGRAEYALARVDALIAGVDAPRFEGAVRSAV